MHVPGNDSYFVQLRLFEGIFAPLHQNFEQHYCFTTSVATGVRTFVPTDIRSHAIFDRAGRTFVLTSNDHPGHSCSHQITTPDIRAHIKLPPRTFVLILNLYNLLFDEHTSKGNMTMCLSQHLFKQLKESVC